MMTAYSLTVTLAALYSNASVALNSVAGPGADLELSARLVAPTIIVASAETVARYHAKVKEQAEEAWFASIWYWLRSRALTAGRMPGGAFINRAMAPSTVSSVGTTPGQLRLLFVSERAHSGCPPLSSTVLSDLRIFTGARVVYALTAPGVAGAVSSTNVYDYRREDEDEGKGEAENARGSSVTAARHSHFGVPMSCLEICLVDTAEHKTTDEDCPRGEVSSFALYSFFFQEFSSSYPCVSLVFCTFAFHSSLYLVFRSVSIPCVPPGSVSHTSLGLYTCVPLVSLLCFPLVYILSFAC